MTPKQIETLCQLGEGISLEFKECANGLSKNVYESVCAFLNRNGGELLLGVRDDGTISGIDSQKLDAIRSDLVTTVNNPQKLSPPCYLYIENIQHLGRDVLYEYVPPSSQVHRCNGRIYDRNEDGDFDITDNHALVSDLYRRKQTSYSENTNIRMPRSPI